MPSLNDPAYGAARRDTRPPGSLGDLKARIGITDLISGYVDLKRSGSERWGRCPFHPDRTPSFKADDRRGRFKCFGCGAAGDAIDFLARIERLDTAAAIRRLRELVGGAPPEPKARAARVAREVATAVQDAVQAEVKRAAAQQFFREGGTIVDGPPWVYLTRYRGLTRWDRDRLRYHPACGFGWIETPPFGFRRTAPAIIAPVNCHRTGHVVGVWRIRLTPTGELVARLGLGDVKGNASRLFPARGDELAVAEGVEDALAYAQMTGRPTWSALSAGNMADLVLPARFARVTVLQDNDPPDHSGRRAGPDAAQALAHRLLAEGRTVEIVRAKHHKDANAVLLEGQAR